MALPSRVLLAVLAGLLPALAAAEDSAPRVLPGETRAQSFAPFVRELGVAVRPWDNSPVNLELKRRFVDALQRRDVRVQDMPAPVVLNFETEVDEAIRSVAPTFGEVRASNREADLRVNLWSTTQHSVLGGQVSGDERAVLRYTLTATLDDERTGRRLWEGKASYTGAAASEAAVLAAMVPVLADQLGQTVRPRRFRIE